MTATEPQAPSTRPPDVGHDRLVRARAGRRVIIGGILLLVLVGASSLLGPTTATRGARGGGYELTVTYPDVTRAGLSQSWSIELRSPGGFDGPVTIAVPHRYLALYDEHGLQPQPSSHSVHDGRVLWEFDPPLGEVLAVSYDGRIQPGRYRGAGGSVAVVEGGTDVVAVPIDTVLIP